MNLINEPWLPVRRNSGAVSIIAPWQLTETHDPVLALSAPRADFNAALMQFLIGLLQTSATPEDRDRWLNRLVSPPGPAQLKDCFEAYAHAFELQAVQGAFMQDYDELDTEAQPIDGLLIDSPGGKTRKKNTDLFVKRERVGRLCPGCTATALFTLQVNAPGGGLGHRTSVRGGGPLTTLVSPDENSDLPCDLWRRLWLNVLEQPELDTLTGDTSRTAPADIFPWLGKTRTSENETGQETTPMDGHPLQMYWAMPRRIRVQWITSTRGQCDVCGSASDRLVTHYHTRNYGTNYTGTWQHPLTPYRVDNSGHRLPQHAQPGGLGYQHWLGMTDDNDNHVSAKVVKRYRSLDENGTQFRLHVFGYDMDKMKARCWYETTYPLFTMPETARIDFSRRVKTLTDTAALIAGYVQRTVKAAWFIRPGDAKGDTAFLRQCFFQHTERAFYQAVTTLQTKLSDRTDREVLEAWHGTLRRAALDLFDYWSARGDVTHANPRRVADARNKLRRQIDSKFVREKLQTADNAREAA